MVVKKIILNLIIVLFVVFVLDFGIGRTLRHYYFNETSGFHFRTTYSIEKTQADILVFGSSRANHHYVPEVFMDKLKMTFYNTGRDGNGIFYQIGILSSVLKRYSPKLIIIDFYEGFNKNENSYNGLESLLPYCITHEEIRRIIEQKSSTEKIKLMSEIYPFNSQILSIGIGNLEINKKRNAEDKGYVPLYKEWQSKIDSLTNAQIYDIDSSKVLAFREFVKLAKQSKAKVLVIYSPIYQKYDKKQEITICANICYSENVSFWDYSKNNLFLNNNRLFNDVSHLNNTGAKLFSELVVSKIKKEIFKTSDNIEIKY